MAETNGIMARLKTATEGLHRMAEGRELQRRLVRGTLPRDLYVAYLGQLYLIHRALETRIREAEAGHRAFALVVRRHHRREPQLRTDLRFFGVEADDIEPIGATTTLLAEIARTARVEPIALLGMLYVLEGSTNGSRLIATALRRAWGLEPGPGLLYLDPYGNLQREKWLAFKGDMDAIALTEAETTGITEAARVVFQTVADVSDELMAPLVATAHKEPP